MDMPTKYGHFRLIPFLQKSNGLEHMAIVKGEWEKDEPILVRVHSSCASGDILALTVVIVGATPQGNGDDREGRQRRGSVS